MQNTALRLVMSSVFGGILLLSGCAELRQESLTFDPGPDCAQAAGKEAGWEYWVLGKTPPLINWTGCDKSGAVLQGAYLGTADLSGTDLRGANLRGADLGAAFLARTNHEGADLSGADATAVYVKDSNLRGAKLTGVTVVGGTYRRVELSGATWIDGETICPEGAMNRCR